MLQCDAVYCSVVQCVADEPRLIARILIMCLSCMLQCVAVCCSVRWRVADGLISSPAQFH